MQSSVAKMLSVFQFILVLNFQFTRHWPQPDDNKLYGTRLLQNTHSEIPSHSEKCHEAT